MKRCILLVLLVLILSLQTSDILAASRPSWEKVKVARVIDNSHLQLSDDRIIRILGMSPPSLFNKKNQARCYARPFFRLLKLLVENKEVQIRADMTMLDARILPRHVKLSNGRNLAEFLLEKGKTSVMTLSKEASFYSKYLKAESIAREEGIGVWQGCYFGNDLKHRMRRSGVNLHHTSQAQFLAPISVGYVKKVLSGNRFELENGLRVKMLGVGIPSSRDVRKGFSCFGDEAKNHLELLILHRQVFLRQDISQMNDDGDLLRYVFLPLQDKRGREHFINEQILLDGYGKHLESEIDQKHEKLLERAQENAYREKKGAWGSCLQAILAEK